MSDSVECSGIVVKPRLLVGSLPWPLDADKGGGHRLPRGAGVAQYSYAGNLYTSRYYLHGVASWLNSIKARETVANELWPVRFGIARGAERVSGTGGIDR